MLFHTYIDGISQFDQKIYLFENFGFLVILVILGDFATILQNSSKSLKIRIFQIGIFFDQIEICHRYRYGKASKDTQEPISGHN